MQHGTPQAYLVNRRRSCSGEWLPVATRAGVASGFTDTNVEVGAPYEYQIIAQYADHRAYGYVYAGIEVPLVEQRGKLILLVDDSMAVPLQSELARLSQDLVGDGWLVLRHDVSRSAAPAQIKAIIEAEYLADPEHVKSLFLLGHIPMYMSGNMAPDGHSRRRWPADLYYGDMHSAWPGDPPSTMPGSSRCRWDASICSTCRPLFR